METASTLANDGRLGARRRGREGLECFRQRSHRYVTAFDNGASYRDGKQAVRVDAGVGVAPVYWWPQRRSHRKPVRSFVTQEKEGSQRRCFNAQQTLKRNVPFSKLIKHQLLVWQNFTTTVQQTTLAHPPAVPSAAPETKMCNQLHCALQHSVFT